MKPEGVLGKKTERSIPQHKNSLFPIAVMTLYFTPSYEIRIGTVIASPVEGEAIQESLGKHLDCFLPRKASQSQ